MQQIKKKLLTDHKIIVNRRKKNADNREKRAAPRRVESSIFYKNYFEMVQMEKVNFTVS